MDLAVLISSLSLLVSLGSLLWNRHTWRAARTTDIRVMAWHDGSGVDVYGPTPDSVVTEHVIAVRVFNHGEQDEHVMWMGVEAVTGDALADDKPTAAKIVDEPPPSARVLALRSQIASNFKLPSDATHDGFVGYAVMGTGERVYSVPGLVDPGLARIHVEMLKAIESLNLDDGQSTP